MTQDEIIDKDEVLKMARQAGYVGVEYGHPALEAFAKLVAAAAASKEREACLKACEQNHFAFFAAKAIRARGQE